MLWGSSESPLEDVSLEDVRLRIRRGAQSDSYGGNVDLRQTRDGEHAIFKRDLPALLAHHVNGLVLQDLRVEWAADVPSFFTHAVECEDFEDVEIRRFRGRQAQKTGAAIRLRRGKDAVVTDSRATAGTDTFLEMTDVAGWKLISTNDTRAARREEPKAKPATPLQHPPAERAPARKPPAEKP